jgi:hypothetical protein
VDETDKAWVSSLLQGNGTPDCHAEIYYNIGTPLARPRFLTLQLVIVQTSVLYSSVISGRCTATKGMQEISWQDVGKEKSDRPVPRQLNEDNWGEHGRSTLLPPRAYGTGS